MMKRRMKKPEWPSRNTPELWPRHREPPNLAMTSVFRTSKEPKVYASERFSCVLFNGKRPQDLPKHDGYPHPALERLLDARLPGWKGGTTRRWSAAGLLADCGNIADAAFLRAVYLYSAMLGPHLFPDGIRNMEGVNALVATPDGPPAAKADSPGRQHAGRES